MKDARKHFADMAGLGEAQQLAMANGLCGRELAAMIHYAEGQEAGSLRDGVLVMLMMVAGRRWLKRQGKKQAQGMRRVRKFL